MKSFLAAIVLLGTALAASAFAGEVKLQVANGRVTLQARDATVREILAEWARVGQVQIVNAERLSGGPVTLDLQGVPEGEALGTLLRSVSGYMAAARSQQVAGASVYDRIVIMAAPRTLTASTGFTPTPPPQQQYGRTMPPGMPNPSMLDDDEPGPQPTYPGSPAYPGAVIQRGTMIQAQPGMTGTPSAPTPGSLPQGAPGTVSPMPQMGLPGQQGVVPPGTGPAGTVSQPVKKPGGPGGTGPGGE